MVYCLCCRHQLNIENLSKDYRISSPSDLRVRIYCVCHGSEIYIVSWSHWILFFRPPTFKWTSEEHEPYYIVFLGQKKPSTSRVKIASALFENGAKSVLQPPTNEGQEPSKQLSAALPTRQYFHPTMSCRRRFTPAYCIEVCLYVRETHKVLAPVAELQLQSSAENNWQTKNYFTADARPLIANIMSLPLWTHLWYITNQQQHPGHTNINTIIVSHRSLVI